MKNNINTQGFFLVLVIIIIVILGLFSVIIWNITKLDLSFIEGQREHLQLEQKYANHKNMIYRFHTTTNTDGFGDDITSCSGGILNYRFKELPKCQGGEIINTPNNIDDFGDNDDFKASFYTGNILEFVTPDSDLYDNDDFSRKYLIGIIPPLEKKTVLVINDPLQTYISLNPNNFSSYQNTAQTLGQIDTLTLFGELSSQEGNINIYTFDKETFNSQKEVQYISHVSGGIDHYSGMLSYLGNINSSMTPFIFHIKDFDYAIVIENTSPNTVLAYNIKGFDKQGNNVYIVGLNDKDGFKNRSVLYQEFIENYYGYVIRAFQ